MPTSRRLAADLGAIDELLRGNARTRDLRSLLVTVVVVGGLYLWFSHRPGPEDDSRFNTVDNGLLRPYMAQPVAQDNTPCQSASCTFEIARPRANSVEVQRAAHYLAPQALTIKAPAGQVIRTTAGFPYTWVATGAAGCQPSCTLAYFSDAKDTPSNGLPQEVAPVAVPSKGYVRSGKEAITGYTVPLADGLALVTKAARNSQPGSYADFVNTAFSEVLFQPVETSMVFEMPANPPPAVVAGDGVLLMFDAERGAGSAEAARLGPFDNPEARVVSVAPSHTPGMLTMQVRFSDEQVDKLISRRIDAERAGHTAFPDNIDLSFINHHNANAARSLNVPASAIARDAKGSYVWVVVEDYAVPVQVEVVSAGEQISSVVEKPGARGLPVRADQWRAMTALGRSRVFDVGYRPEAANGNRLLTVNSPVILQPATSLAPGARVRINDAKKS